jgi:hypothetical protein
MVDINRPFSVSQYAFLLTKLQQTIPWHCIVFLLCYELLPSSKTVVHIDHFCIINEFGCLSTRREIERWRQLDEGTLYIKLIIFLKIHFYYVHITPIHNKHNILYILIMD